MELKQMAIPPKVQVDRVDDGHVSEDSIDNFAEKKDP